MAKEKEPVTTPPAPPPPASPQLLEKEPDKVLKLEDLQDQAKFNTRCLTADSRRLTDADRELKDAEHQFSQIEEDPSDPKELVKQQTLSEKIGKLRKEKERLVDQINKRRARSGSLIRRRASLETERLKKEQQQREHDNAELASKLKIGDLLERRRAIESELARFAEDCVRAQLKVTAPEQRDLARRLMALQRACFAGLEALKRAPELVMAEVE